MSGTEFVVAPDRWSLARRPRFALRRNRVLPGPLKPLAPRRGPPAWVASLGLAGLSVAAALAIAPQIRVAAPAAEPVPAASPLRPALPETAPAVRMVATETPAPAPAIEPPVPAEPAARQAAVEPPVPAPAVAPPRSAPRIQAAFLDPGALPVLELDAAAFDPPVAPVPDAAPRSAKPPARNAARTPQAPGPSPRP